MATILSHPIIPLTLGIIATTKVIPWRLIVVGMIFSIIPDADVIGFKFAVPYSSPFGHRGFTHSLFFAAIIALLPALFSKNLKSTAFTIWIFLFVATMSHGVIDALTTGGLGVEFFWPLSETRYFLPYQIIEVSPIGVKNFLTERGWAVMLSEICYLWLPCISLIFLSQFFYKTLNLKPQ